MAEFFTSGSDQPLGRSLLQNPRLPLAVYREVEAHLRQVSGVNAGLLPQTSQTFDYSLSQVGGLWIEYTEAANDHARRRVEQILLYYGDRYGAWEVLQP
ncbi:MAG TPA: hypothetical protein IGS37_04455 [Synechococcales cyanobacterium M55_K2018_004]|nr:hypothetical protein [Synechococcales cyanobacterium M55_K2018_004]